MANNKADQPPTGQEPIKHGSTIGSSAPHVAFESEKEAVEQPGTLETVQTNQTTDEKEAQRANSIEALGIPDWEAKQKKIVRTLDMTLLPQLWILYMFNYLVGMHVYELYMRHTLTLHIHRIEPTLREHATECDGIIN